MYPSIWAFAYDVRFQGDQIARHCLRNGRKWPLGEGLDGDDGDGEPLVASPEGDEGGDEAGDDDAGASATGGPVVVHGPAGAVAGRGQDVGSALFGVDGHDGVRGRVARTGRGTTREFQQSFVMDCRRRRLEMQAKAVGAEGRSGPRGYLSCIIVVASELGSWRWRHSDELGSTPKVP